MYNILHPNSKETKLSSVNLVLNEGRTLHVCVMYHITFHHHCNTFIINHSTMSELFKIIFMYFSMVIKYILKNATHPVPSRLNVYQLYACKSSIYVELGFVNKLNGFVVFKSSKYELRETTLVLSQWEIIHPTLQHLQFIK